MIYVYISSSLSLFLVTHSYKSRLPSHACVHVHTFPSVLERLQLKTSHLRIEITRILACMNRLSFPKYPAAASFAG